MASTSTAVQIKAFGTNYDETVTIAQVPVPEPGPGEALVRITCRPVNPADVFSVMGVYPGFAPKGMPAVPGLEGVGTVAKLGPGTNGRVKEGERVVNVGWTGTRVGNGTWQQYMVVPEEDLVPVPSDLTDEAACQALVNPVTVIGMFELINAPKGEYVIISAAGSALGRMCLRYARHLGLKTIGTCRRQELAEELRQAGADEVVVVASDADYPALVERAQALTGGRGAWAALECLAGDQTQHVAGAVRQGGTLVLYGGMAGPVVQWGLGQGLFRMMDLKGFWLVPWLDSMPKDKQREVLATALEHMRSGLLPPAKVTVMPLTEAAAALKAQAVVGRTDKVVLQG